MKPLTFAFLLFISSCTAFLHAEEDSWRLEFNDRSAAESWQIVNDGVMGGKSSSQVSVTNDGHLKFRGTLSLANNGGFASVRLRPRQLGLTSGQTITMRVKGDGRRYTFNLYPSDQRTAYSFQKDFETKAEEWTEIELPIEQFVAHWYGRPRKMDKLNPEKINSIGILLGDKMAGPFELLVDAIICKSAQ